MPKVWFTSDTHFGHGLMIKVCKRPFSSVEEMTEGMIQRWNEVVKPEDDIYVLGDVFWCSKDRAREIAGRLNGRKHLVRGNHDSNSHINAVKDLFEWVKDYHLLKTRLSDGTLQLIALSHYPMLRWDQSHRGSWMLHGHTHGGLGADTNALRHDVGVDCNDWRPISLHNVEQIMAKKFSEEPQFSKDMEKLFKTSGPCPCGFVGEWRDHPANGCGLGPMVTEGE